MNYLIGGSIVAVAGTSIISHAVNSILITSYNTICYLKNGSETNEQINDITREITKFDLDMKFRLVHELLTDKKNDNNVIAKIIENDIVELIDKIKKLLEEVKSKIEYHKTLWFSSYRNLDIGECIKNLSTYNSILETRIKLLS